MLTGGSWDLDRNTEPFPHPFFDYASTVMPRTIREAMAWGEMIFTTNGIYSSATDRLLSYFITDLNYDGEDLGDDEKIKYEFYYNRVLRYRTLLKKVGRDFLCYGNTFNSLFMPFKRYLRCPKCAHERPHAAIRKQSERYQFEWSGCRFFLKCPSCGYKGDWGNPIDRVIRDENKIVIKHWNPKYIDLQHNRITEAVRVIWRIPEQDRRDIRVGYEHILEDTPWEFIEAVRHNANVRFKPDEVFHWREEPLAGQELGGWGLPRSVTNGRQAWYVQVLHRLNEAIAMDFVVPFRLISPAAGKTADPEAGDLLANFSLGNFTSMVERMLRLNRRDPARWNIAPIPMQYQILGGEAKNLAPYELLDQGISNLLNSIGYPVDFYKFSLDQKMAPVAARILASIWVSLVDGMNAFLQWTAERTSRSMLWEKADITLKRTEVLDALQDPTLDLQLAAQRMVSQTTALKRMDKSFKGEQKQIIEDEQYLQELQVDTQKEMEQAAIAQQMVPAPMQQYAAQQQQGGAPGQPPPAGGAAPPAGGAPAQGGMPPPPPTPNQPQSPQELMAQAKQWSDVMMRMPESQRQSQMLQLKRTSPTVWAQTRALMDDVQQQAATAGKAMVLNQQYPGHG